jgi:hypothetical protein
VTHLIPRLYLVAQTLFRRADVFVLSTALPAVSKIPYLPCEQFEYDQKTNAAAWRLTGELLNRVKACGC